MNEAPLIRPYAPSPYPPDAQVDFQFPPNITLGVWWNKRKICLEKPKIMKENEIEELKS